MLKVKPGFVPPRNLDADTADTAAASHKNGRVSYSPERDGSLAVFEAMPKRAELIRQYEAGAEQMSTFAAEQGSSQAPAVRRGFRRFVDRVKQGSAPGSYHAHNIGEIYGIGKESFDAVSDFVANETIPAKTRLTTVENLSKELQACAVGAGSRLKIMQQEIELSVTGVAGRAAIERNRLAYQAVLEFVTLKHGHTLDRVGQEVHRAVWYRHALDDEYGKTARPNEAKPPEITARLEQECRAYVEKRATPARLVGNLAESCLERVHEELSAYRHQSLSAEQMSAIYARYPETIETEIRQNYGDVQLADFIHEYQVDGEDSTSYRLIEDPALLVRPIAENLANAGFLDAFESIDHGRLSTSDTIRQVGDAVYVERRGAQGDVGYRSLNMPDLRSASLVGMPVGALLNRLIFSDVRDRTEVSDVARLIGSGEHWVSHMTSPGVIAYRQSSPANDEALLAHADTTLKACRFDADRLRVLSAAMEAGDEPLALCAARSLDKLESRGNHSPISAALDKGMPTLAGVLSGKVRRHWGDQPSWISLTLVKLVETDQLDILEKLIQSGAQVNVSFRKGHGGTQDLLSIATRGGNAEIVGALIRAGADPSAAFEDAVDEGNGDKLKLLVQAGARVDKKCFGDRSMTPLEHVCQARGSIDHALLKTLLELKADPNVRSLSGISSLARAAKLGDIVAVKLLLEAGADVDAREGDLEKQTPLMHAARRGSVDVVRALVDAGAKVRRTNYEGRTALDILGPSRGERENYTEIRKILSGAGARSGLSRFLLGA